MTKNSTRAIAPSAWSPNADVLESLKIGDSNIESGFYTGDRGLPWHIEAANMFGQDHLMQDAGRLLTKEEAREAAGLDWDVWLRPLYVSLGRRKVRVPDRFATVRSDNEAVLGVGMTPSYKLTQNDVLFDFADALVDSGEAKYETGGSLYFGRKVFLSMEVPDDIHVEGDPSDYRLFLVVSTGHDGKTPTKGSVTVERTVCANTLRVAHEQAISSFTIRHTASMEGRLTQAREALGITFRYAEDFGKTASALVATPLVERQVEAILRSVFPVPETKDNPEKVDQTAYAKVRTVYEASPSVEPVKGTAYGVLNAVTEYIDHLQEWRGRSVPAEEVKADNLMFDGLASAKKQRTWDTLVGIAKEEGVLTK